MITSPEHPTSTFVNWVFPKIVVLVLVDLFQSKNVTCCTFIQLMQHTPSDIKEINYDSFGCSKSISKANKNTSQLRTYNMYPVCHEHCYNIVNIVN